MRSREFLEGISVPGRGRGRGASAHWRTAFVREGPGYAARPGARPRHRLRSLWWLCLAVVLWALIAVRSAAAGSGPVASAAWDTGLAGVPALQLRLDLDVADADLGSLLPRLGQQVGVRLAAARDLRDLKVTLKFSQAPAVQILTLLSRRLDLSWVRSGGGFELMQSLRARQREAAARDQGESEAWDYAMAVLRTAPEQARRDPLEVRAEEERLKAGVAAAELGSEARHRAGQRLAEFRDRIDTRGPFASRLFSTLSPSQVRGLRSGGPVVLRTVDGTLNGAALAAARELLAPSTRSIRENPSGEQTEEIIVRCEFERGRELNWGSHPQGGKLEGKGLIVRFRSELRSPGSAASVGDQWLPSRAIEPPRAASGGPDPIDLHRPIDLKPIFPTADGESEETPSIPLSKVLRHAASQLGFNGYSESFVRLWVSLDALESVRTLGQLLSVLEDSLDLGWRFEGGVLALTSHTWAEDRAREVPTAVVKKLRGAATRSPSAVLATMAECARELSDERLSTLQEYWLNYMHGTLLACPPVSGGVFDARRELRLWGSLSPMQRQRLLTGAWVLDRSWTPEQQARLLDVLTAPADEDSVPAADSSLMARCRGNLVIRMSSAEVLLRVFSNSAEYLLESEVLSRRKVDGEFRRAGMERLYPIQRYRLEVTTPPLAKFEVMLRTRDIPVRRFGAERRQRIGPPSNGKSPQGS